MSLFRPSTLLPHLEANNLHPKKRLSQNFLIDGNIIRKIVQTARVEQEDLVVEIGPGPGALTQALLQKGCQLLAVEKDDAFAEALQALSTSDNRLEIFAEDALTFPLESLLQERLKIGQKAKVVANLPYHITTPILSRLLPLHSLIDSLTLMVQKEVALRFVAKKNCSDYSSLTLFTNFYSTPTLAFTVEPTCFYPKPKVQSAVVHFVLKQPPLETPLHPKFFKLTRSTFQKRRKMLRSSLKEQCSPSLLEELLKEQGLSGQARPEDLDLNDFLALFRGLNGAVDEKAEESEHS